MEIKTPLYGIYIVTDKDGNCFLQDDKGNEKAFKNFPTLQDVRDFNENIEKNL